MCSLAPALLPRTPSLSQCQEESALICLGKDLDNIGGQEEEAAGAEAEAAEDEEGKGPAGRKGAAPKEGGEEQEQLEEEEEVEEVEEVEEEVELELEEKEEEEEEDQCRRSSRSLEEAFEQELIAQLEGYEQVIQEFQADLEITRTRYSLATGGALGARGPPEGGRPRGLRDTGRRQPSSAWGHGAHLSRRPSPRPSLSSPPRLTQGPSHLYNAKWISRKPNCRR